MIDTIAPMDWATSDEIIKVLGVGGGGCNAVNYMFTQGIKGCSFVVCNTDSQALKGSPKKKQKTSQIQLLFSNILP